MSLRRIYVRHPRTECGDPGLDKRVSSIFSNLFMLDPHASHEDDENDEKARHLFPHNTLFAARLSSPKLNDA